MSLEDAVLLAHQRGDASALVALYCQAAEAADSAQMAGFYYTHAHVFALECDHPDAPYIRQLLMDAGREAPLPPPQPPLR